MNLLFVHQNFPGQYLHLAMAFAGDRKHRVRVLGEQKNFSPHRAPPGVEGFAYPTPNGGAASTHPYLRRQEAEVRRGQAVARALLAMRTQGFVPDVICAHPGWGECLFIKDIFPDTPLLGYFEFFYRSSGSDVGFDPATPVDLDDACRIRMKNATMLTSLASADAGVAPTEWQRAQFPAEYRGKIQVTHDGIDTETVRPDPGDTLTLPDGTVLRSGDKVVTYVARNLEPYRGFDIFMRALPALLDTHRDAQVLIVGGDEVSYGRAPGGGRNHRETMLAELAGRLDTRRVHFLGRVPYRRFLSVLHVSSVHAYLTYPFVLSWSMLEAMAAGCLVVASCTAPVTEVIEDGVNGWLTDFFAVDALAERLSTALTERAKLGSLREAARRTIVDRYDLRGICLPQQMALIRRLAA